MIVDVDKEETLDGARIFLVGDTGGDLSIKEYVEMISMMVCCLDVFDPARFYKREWEEGKSCS